MTEFVVIFLLFFAVLAAAWFYVQRAKARDAAKTTHVETTETDAAQADATASPAHDRPE